MGQFCWECWDSFPSLTAFRSVGLPPGSPSRAALVPARYTPSHEPWNRYIVQHLNLPALPPLALSISPQDQTVTLLKDCGKTLSYLARCRDSWILSQSDLTRLQLGTELSSSSVALRYFLSRGPLEDLWCCMYYCSTSTHKVRTWELLPGYLRENQSLNQALIFQLRQLSSSYYEHWLECFWAWSSIQGPSVMPMALVNTGQTGTPMPTAKDPPARARCS